MTDHDRYLIKQKSAGIPDYKIAQRMGMTAAEVDRRWTEIVDELEAQKVSGIEDLNARFLLMCQEYVLLGTSLRVMGAALGNLTTDDELRALLDTEDKEAAFKALRKSCIVLRAFVPPSPEVEMQTEKTQPPV